MADFFSAIHLESLHDLEWPFNGYSLIPNVTARNKTGIPPPNRGILREGCSPAVLSIKKYMMCGCPWVAFNRWRAKKTAPRLQSERGNST